MATYEESHTYVPNFLGLFGGSGAVRMQDYTCLLRRPNAWMVPDGESVIVLLQSQQLCVCPHRALVFSWCGLGGHPSRAAHDYPPLSPPRRLVLRPSERLVGGGEASGC